MDLSIIIAHFDPGKHPNCFESFQKTLQSISDQKDSFNIEVIVSDDGSQSNSQISTLKTGKIEWNDRTIFDLSNKPLHDFLEKNNTPNSNISHWLYLPKDKHCMSKARLWNVAASLAKSEHLFFLDDDNYFISDNSIETIINLFNDYSVIFGQIQDSNGRFRLFESKRVQGTTFGIKKSILNEIGGFGEWTEQISCGIDSDLWYKLYKHHQLKNYKACFTDSIQTIDSCSKRWRPFIGTFFRNRKSVKKFKQEHGCKDYRKSKYNSSRLKHLWLENLVE